MTFREKIPRHWSLRRLRDRHVEGPNEPINNLLAEIRVELSPFADVVRAAGDGDQVAGIVVGFHPCLEVEGALIGDAFVGVALDEEERRQAGLDVIDGGHFVEDFSGFTGDLFGGD